MLTAIQNTLNLLAEHFDLPMLDWIQSTMRSDFLDTVMPIITLLGDAGIFWIICAVILMFVPGQRKAGFSMGLALMLGLVVCNIILKPTIARIRPYDYQLENLGKEIILLIDAQHDFSFPSGHTIASFEACTALMLHNRKLGIPACILAVLIAFSRLYLYVHYPTDVFASIILGFILAWIATWIVHSLSKVIPTKKGKYAR